MAKQKKSMLDGDFIDDDEDDFSMRDDAPIDVSDDEGDDGITSSSFDHVDEPEKKAKPEKDGDEITVDVVSDIPDKDKGKWVIDPDKDGDPPEVNDKEIRQYSRDVQKRIKNATARAHAERRRADEQSRMYTEVVKVAEELIKRNNQLTELVENGEKVLVGEHKGRLEATLNAAKQAYREAAEAGDIQGQIAAQENIAKAAAAIDRVSTHRSTPLQKESEEEFRKRFAPVQQPAQNVVDEATQKWAAKNDWFGVDTLMTGYAVALDAEVKRRGIQPTDPSYWKTIDTEMRKRFPEKFGAPVRRQATIVAPANRSGSIEGRRVTLTESQARIAKRLGLSNEQYARQLIKEEEARNDG